MALQSCRTCGQPTLNFHGFCCEECFDQYEMEMSGLCLNCRKVHFKSGCFCSHKCEHDFMDDAVYAPEQNDDSEWDVPPWEYDEETPCVDPAPWKSEFEGL